MLKNSKELHRAKKLILFSTFFFVIASELCNFVHNCIQIVDCSSNANWITLNSFEYSEAQKTCRKNCGNQRI